MKKENLRIFSKTLNRCAYCGCLLDDDHSKPNGGVSSYIKPLSKGGTKEDFNLIGACRNCTGRRGNRSLDNLRRHVAMEELGYPRFSEEQHLWLEKMFGWVAPRATLYVDRVGPEITDEGIPSEMPFIKKND